MLKIKNGITQKQIAQLLNFSQNDPVIAKFTTDKTRFASKVTFESWRKTKGHIIYTLEGEKKELEGIMWLSFETSPQLSPQYGISFGIRIYEPYRGKGLSFNFMKTCFDKFHKTKSYQKTANNKIWISTSKDNLAAIALYKKSGFRQIFHPDKEGKILMVLN
jgi:RimJ/RimL family protein N-acetyltransferase